MLARYRDPATGIIYQYEEGTQPASYVPAVKEPDVKAVAAPKNKARTAAKTK